MCGGGSGRRLVVSYRSSSGKPINHWSRRVSKSASKALLDKPVVCRTGYILETMAPESIATWEIITGLTDR